MDVSPTPQTVAAARDFISRFLAARKSDVRLVDAPLTNDTGMDFPRSVERGFAERPRQLDCRFLYDAEGSRLFEEITAQPEYYPTRTEAELLRAHANEIRACTGPVSLVELGSGYSVKTEAILNAYTRRDAHVEYVPVDVSAEALRAAERSITQRFPQVKFTGIRGSYASAFAVLPHLKPQLLIFLGSTIGNFDRADTEEFWRSVERGLPEDGFFLLGVDLVKDAERLEAAYDDRAGVTARFTKNYFTRMNRELGADFDVDGIRHVATWNAELDQVEIRARFESAQRVHFTALDRSYDFASGEEIFVEISRKFRLGELREELHRHGLATQRCFTAPGDAFGLLLLKRNSSS